MFTIDSGRYVGSDCVTPIMKVGENFAIDFVGNRLRFAQRTYNSAFKVPN